MSEDEEPRSRPTQLVASYMDGRVTHDSADLHARMGMLTAFVGGILFEIDLQGRYISVITGDPALLARPVSELHTFTVAEVLGPEVGESFLALFRRVIGSGRAESMEYTLDVPAGRRNFRCEARPTLHLDGTSSQTVTLLVRDVTEETALKAKLLEAERLAAMGLVAASIGHEIRQPLAFATTSLEVLSRELSRVGSDGVTATEALTHVRDAIQRIAGIASSVGIVAQDRQREITTDIRRPIEAAVDLCASELQGARVVLSLEPMPRVTANEGELCQVIVNLLLNAAHAADPAIVASSSTSSHRIEVIARLAENGTKVRISVIDAGRGIDPVNVARVFDPFFTTKEPGSGTGIGLFVSRRIIEQSGGTLQIESKHGSGTTAHILLPVVVADAAPASATTPIATPTRLDVLVIDDEPAFLRSLELVLEGTHNVTVCRRSIEALELVRENPRRFDVVLCDLSMPDLDGAAFHAEMEVLGIADRFVLMTAGAFTPRSEEFLREAKCRRIGKPFTFEKLLSVLDAAAEESEQTHREPVADSG